MTNDEITEYQCRPPLFTPHGDVPLQQRLIFACLLRLERKFTKYFYEEQQSEAQDDPQELEEAGHRFGPLSIENLNQTGPLLVKDQVASYLMP